MLPTLASVSTLAELPGTYEPFYDRTLCLMILPAWPTPTVRGIEWDNRRQAVLCWGKLYEPLPISTMVEVYPELSKLLSLGLVARRSLYLHGLYQLLALANLHGPASLKGALLLERGLWEADDLTRIQQRIFRRCTGDVQDPADHWLWQGPTKYSRPTTDWEGTQDVAVYRILWTHYRPRFLIDDTMRPRRHPRSCPTGGPGGRCVNPWHFEYAVPLHVGRGDRARVAQADDLVPGYKPVWRAGEHTAYDSNGHAYIRCPNDPAHGPLGEKTQVQFSILKLPKGRGYCPKCRAKWNATRIVVEGRTYPRQDASKGRPSVPQLEERVRSQRETDTYARRREQDVLDAVRAIEDAFGPGSDPMHPAEGI